MVYPCTTLYEGTPYTTTVALDPTLAALLNASIWRQNELFLSLECSLNGKDSRACGGFFINQQKQGFVSFWPQE